ncbi:MAG: HAMP domain-containing histidine kinase [Phycisphaerae bacterium]|nr:HAMP domain-containing histidine kinase [Phycisphaerae bacterium]
MTTVGEGEIDASTHQQQLARLEKEVAALRRQLRHAQRLATVGTMTAMVAHEFNNILTPIINYARLARSNPALSGKAIERAAAGGEQAATICRAILDMTRDDGAEPQAVQVADLVAETLSALARDPAKDAIELLVDVPEHLFVTVRRGELQQVLMNLLINARHAVVAGTQPRRIELRARSDEGGLQIEVADSGVGIPPDDLQRIFEPFYTTRGDGTSDSGHGLGLTLCRDIVESMRGRIEVTSTVGAGATFTLFLPAEAT